MSGEFSGKILGAFDNAGGSITILANHNNYYFAIIDIIIVSILIYYFYKFLSQTRALVIIYGLAVLAFFWFIGQLFNLVLLNTILKWMFTPFLIAIPVVFQPELRSGLEKLGRSTKFVTDFNRLTRSDIEDLVDKIIQALNILASNKYGALIVISRSTGLKEYASKGQNIFAEVNTKLLVNIFTPKAPLHDGAVIISGRRIVAAAVTLPIADDVIDLSLGTRHKAALSISMDTDAVALIVSEETGAVSLAVDGRMQKNIAVSDLKARLLRLLSSRRKSKKLL